MIQCINKPIQSMDLSKVLLHSSNIIYNRILSYIYTSFAPWKYILLFKFVCILINVRKLLFLCVPISLFYSIVYILIFVCLGVSYGQSDIEVRHAHYTICMGNRTHGKSSLHSNNFQYGSVARSRICIMPNHTFLIMNQVVFYNLYAFVSSKLLFIYVNNQCKFRCCIYTISAGNCFKLLITINLLIAFFPIFSELTL